MTRATHNTIQRIHRDREKLRVVLQRRLSRVTRDMAAAAARSSKPELSVAANDELAPMIARIALTARLSGLRRSLLEFKAGTGIDLAKRVNLSREADKDDKKDREFLLWLIAFLTPIVGQQLIADYRGRAVRVGRRVAEQIKTPVMRELAGGVSSGFVSIRQPVGVGKSEIISHLNPVPRVSSDPFGDYGKPDQAGTLVDDFAPRVDRVGRAREIRKAFDKSGVGKVSTRLIDTWAETVSYVEFESGRRDGDALPAVSEMLYGYRWSSVLDNRTTEICRHLDNSVFRKDDPILKSLEPPAHFNCRSVLVPVYQSSALKEPTPIPPKASHGDLMRWEAQREKYRSYL